MKPDFGDKRKSTSHQTRNPSNCHNCGHQHPPKLCPAFGNEFRKCKKKNDLAKFCLLSSPIRIIKAVNKKDLEECYVFEVIEETNQAESNLKEASAVVKTHGSDVRVTLDTEAEVNVIPDRVLTKVMANNKTQPTKRKLI